MARYTATLSESISAQDSLMGALDDGYFVIQTYSGGTATANLYNASNGTAVLDSVAIVDPVSERSGFNCAGDAYYAYNTTIGGTWTLRSVTQSGGALSIGTVVTGVANNITGINPVPDNSQVQMYASTGTDIVHGISVSGGTVSWTATIAASGHSGFMHSSPAADRFLWVCGTHNELELWDGPGNTVLDTMAFVHGTADLSDSSGVAFATDKVLAAGNTTPDVNPDEVFFVCISSSGDTLSFDWGVNTITTDWSNASANGAVPKAWGPSSIGVLAPQQILSTGTIPQASLVLIDLATGTANLGTADGVVGAGTGFWSGGGFFSGMAGPSWYVKVPSTLYTPPTGIWSVALSTGPTFLRQRQSPVRSPSRVDYPTLRQRQTPFYTR